MTMMGWLAFGKVEYDGFREWVEPGLVSLMELESEGSEAAGESNKMGQAKSSRWYFGKHDISSPNLQLYVQNNQARVTKDAKGYLRKMNGTSAIGYHV